MRDARPRASAPAPALRPGVAAALRALAAVLLCATGCGDGSTGTPTGPPPLSGPATITMPIGTATFTLEVADTPEKRETGLMFRDSLPADRGVLFVFPDEGPRAFWMKDTRIPLDLVYVSADHHIVSIHALKPFDLTPVVSAGPAKYAIELNVNTASTVGVRPGDTLEMPAAVRAIQ